MPPRATPMRPWVAWPLPRATPMRPWVARNPSLRSLHAPIIGATGDLGGLTDALAVVTAGTDAAMLKIAAPNASLMAALDTLGIKSTEMKNSELADLEQAVQGY